MGFDTSAQHPRFGRAVFKSSDVTASSTPESSGEISSCVLTLKSPSLTFSWGSTAGRWPLSRCVVSGGGQAQQSRRRLLFQSGGVTGAGSSPCWLLSTAHLYLNSCSIHMIRSVSSENAFPAPSGFLGFHATSTGNKIIIIMITLQQKGYPQNYIVWKKQGS